MACTAVLFDGRWWVLFTGLFGRGLNVLGSGFLFFWVWLSFLQVIDDSSTTSWTCEDLYFKLLLTIAL